MLPLRRPFWMLVLIAMLGFGFLLEGAKIHINDYLAALEAHPEWVPLPPEARAEAWKAHVPPRVVNYYEITAPAEVFHRLDPPALWILKWTLAVVGLVLFFLLDALFLRVTGAWNVRSALLALYALVGLLMAAFAAFAPGDAGYAVARELLGFLQSPLPSLLLVFFHWAFRSGIAR